MADREKWWVACGAWARPKHLRDEEEARRHAEALDALKTCDNPHFYWRNDDHGPEYDSIDHIIIPEGAKRP